MIGTRAVGNVESTKLHRETGFYLFVVLKFVEVVFCPHRLPVGMFVLFAEDRFLSVNLSRRSASPQCALTLFSSMAVPFSSFQLENVILQPVGKNFFAEA